MKGFSANFDSSPSSTPNEPQRRRNIFANATPELASTTPLAPPPSHPFGSSRFGSGVSKLQLGKTPGSQRSAKSPLARAQVNSRGLQNQQFQSSLNPPEVDYDGSEQYTQDFAEGGWEDEDQSQQLLPPFNFGMPEVHKQRDPAPVQSLMKFSTASSRQPPSKIQRGWSRSASQYSELPRRGKEDFIPGLARDLCKRSSPAKLENDADDAIVGSEQVLRQLDEEDRNTKDGDLLRIILSECAQELSSLWEAIPQSRKASFNGLEIGPGPDASEFEHARFIAILILQLYNPTIDEEGFALPMAERLLDWLNKYHATYDVAFHQVVNTSPNMTANELFWEVVENLTARGRFEDVMRLLAEADFAYAFIETDHGIEDANYSGAEQQAIQAAVFRIRQVMNACPAVQSKDWNVNNQDWDLFRKDVETVLDELTELASGFAEEDDDSQALPSLSSFGTSRKQGKGLPFDVYGHLKTILGILLGSSSEIISISNDWLETSMLLTIWWNGPSQQQVAQWSFDVSRANNKQDLDDYNEDQYLKRLRDSFLAVTDPSSDDSFQLNPLSALQLSVGAILQGDLSSALSLLQTLSLCLASAMAELGTVSGYLRGDHPPEGLGREDLMVLTNGASDIGFQQDNILERYARALFDKPIFTTSDGVPVEGWELAFSVASRIEDHNLVKATILSFLEELPVTQKDRAERLVTLCDSLGLKEESRKVSEAFGDHLVNNTTNYGLALLCYARSHSETKVRQLIDLLNSYCLVQSKAYPTDEDIDQALQHLVSNPRAALSGIAEVDPTAVEVLQFYLVGYACIRRFYTLRDEGVESSDNHSAPSVVERKKSASRTLLAAINSAADSIYGGLYDPERQSAIQVDGLLALLGEATALIAQHNEKRILTSEQMYALLAAIEDIQTVSDRVYSAAEECLEASLRNFHGSLPPSPHAMLKKSMSSGTNSNFSFSMMGSEMLSRSEESVGAKSLGSAVLVGKSGQESNQVKRAWDWRDNFKDQGTTGADVLRFLRIGIANELSIASLEEI